MRTVRTLSLNLAALTLSTAFFAGCNDDDPQKASLGDYFPLNQGLEWKYNQTLVNGDSDPIELGQVEWRVDGDTIIDNKLFVKIMDTQSGFIEKAVRKEGSQFFGRNHELYGGFTHEYVFLDTEVQQGSSWHYFKFDGAIKTEYVVKSFNGVRTVNAVKYDNVLELEVNYYEQVSPGEYKLSYTVVHVYAKDVGEIYSYYPYPASGFFGDVRTELVSIKR